MGEVGGWCYLAEGPPVCPPKDLRGLWGGQIGVSILFPKMTHILTLKSVGTGADSVQGLGVGGTRL